MSLDRALEDRIAREIAAWQRAVTARGEPLRVDEAWLRTPPGLRMAFQVLKNADVPPAEIELMHRRAQLRERLAEATEPERRQDLQRQLADLEQHIALRLEALRKAGDG